jgi:DNA replication and repair protein RecF
MPIKKMIVTDFRNFESQSLQFSDGINIFFGVNGAGKTSVLEALNFALTGRSFRTSNIKNAIRENTERTVVFVQASDNKENVLYNIGVEKTFHTSLMKLNNIDVSSFADLARILPVQVIEPSNLNLLEGPPEGRRRYLDWLVFHVEHEFSHQWKRYKNILKQRNSLLRRGKIEPLELDVWDTQLASYGEYISECRQKNLDALQPFFSKYLNIFGLGLVGSTTFKYVRGWEKNSTLLESLKSSRENDIRKAHTKSGPHRSDIRIELNGKPAGEVLSRGQQKVFCVCMKLAQCDYLRVRSGKESVFLLDDIASELDTLNLEKVYESLQELNAQVLLTSIQAPVIPTSQIKRSNTVFHVEHGIISQKN